MRGSDWPEPDKAKAKGLSVRAEAGHRGASAWAGAFIAPARGQAVAARFVAGQIGREHCLSREWCAEAHPAACYGLLRNGRCCRSALCMVAIRQIHG